jgi:hypothetical protein
MSRLERVLKDLKKECDELSEQTPKAQKKGAKIISMPQGEHVSYIPEHKVNESK